MAGSFGSGIKSVQRGVVTLDANPDTVTITAVVPAKSFLLMNFTGAGDVGMSGRFPRGVLTNETTITFDEKTTDASMVAWQVVEYY